MKFRHLFYLLASLSMVLSACESDDETSGNNEPPEVALPSVHNFLFGKLFIHHKKIFSYKSIN